MDHKSVRIQVVVDAKIFHQFVVFDNLIRKRGLASPAIFACILCVFALVCHLFLENGTGLGNFLLFVGLGLPAFQIWRFFRSIQRQIKIYGLETPKTVYSLHFSEVPEGIAVSNHGLGDEVLRYAWKHIHKVYRLDGCSYLYVLPEKAFLLPDGQAEEGTEALWQLLTEMLPPEKLQDRRRKK